MSWIFSNPTPPDGLFGTVAAEVTRRTNLQGPSRKSSSSIRRLRSVQVKAAASQPGGTWKDGLPWYDVPQTFLPFIVGVVLFANGRRWAVALTRRQGQSSLPATTVSGTHETET